MKDHIVGRLTTFFIQITGDGACDSSGVTHVLDAGDVPDGLGVHEVFDEPKY